MLSCAPGVSVRDREAEMGFLGTFPQISDKFPTAN